MILIFDSFGGLCNQFLDIQTAINFSNKNKYYFTFRYCSFRQNDLKLFYNKSFDSLFDKNMFKNINYYIDFEKIKNKINENNTFNLQQKRTIELFKNENELNQLIKNTKFKYIVLSQFFSICQFNKLKNYYIKIKPNPKLYSIFLNIKKHLLPEKYNFLHFRYENDFTSFFNINYVLSIDSLLQRLNFKNKNFKLYIACSDIKNLSKTIYLANDIYSYKNILFKDDHFEKYKLNNLNFEEKAFIDFLIGVHSNEIFGHSKSSFSSILNMFHNTHNYYDIY